MTAEQVHVCRDDLTSATLVEVEQGPLADDAVRFVVEAFSVTSNNITYAVAGDSFGYWNFFPAPEGFGIVPMWGHARVIESNCPEIAVGERVYGYLPMATHLDVLPGHISPGGFVDEAAHRQPMSPIYNRYSRLAADPQHDPAHEAERMIYGPLFLTGYLIEYFMRSEDWFGAEQVILTSASSKTAMGLASVAQNTSPDITRIGLTSAGNVEFVRGTGLYDAVVAYDDITTLTQVPSVSVDFAGSGPVLKTLHEHLFDVLKYSCRVGLTHIADRASPGDGELPGPAPIMFFAPDHAVALYKELGPEEAGRRMAEALRGFLGRVAGTVTVDRRQGLKAARTTYLEMISGKVDPSQGIVVEP